MKRAVFIDKDGTLVEDVPYNVDPDRIVPTAGAFEALRSLRDAGYLLIVVSNQPGMAQGRFAADDLGRVAARLHELFGAHGLVLAAFHWCPHDPQGEVAEYAHACDCRKPAPGLLLDAAERHGVDLARSWMIGDILDDVEAGHRAGCRAVLLDSGHETEWRQSGLRRPDYTVHTFAEAAGVILGRASAKLETAGPAA